MCLSLEALTLYPGGGGGEGPFHKYTGNTFQSSLNHDGLAARIDASFALERGASVIAARSRPQFSGHCQHLQAASQCLALGPSAVIVAEQWFCWAPEVQQRTSAVVVAELWFVVVVQTKLEGQALRTQWI